MNSESHFLRAGAWLTLLLMVASCSWLRGGEGLLLEPEDDYLDVVEQPPLSVPADLRDLRNTDPFPIPQTAEALNPRYYPDRPPLPDAIYANDNRDEVRIQRLGSRRWLVIPESPTTAWPKLKQFLAENGVSVDYEAPEVGRINTAWLRIEDTQYRDVIRTLMRDAKRSASLMVGMDRFLIRVEQGLRPLTTEIHARHENDSLTLPVADDVLSLQSLYSDVDTAEADFLNEVGAYVAAKVAQQTVSKVAQQIGSQQKAELARDPGGYPLLRLFLDYERAWATMGQALENAEIEIIDLDRDTGTFNVAVDSALLTGEEGGGFFCRITFSCGDSRKDHVLQLQLSNPTDQVFEVNVLNPQTRGQIDPDLAQQILLLLRDYAA